jgi:hypothetical protein
MISVKRLKILQILSQHLDYGGEERIAVKIEDALAEQHELFRYMGSTRRLLGQTPLAPILVPWRAWRNPQVLRDLEHEQRQNRYDLWLVHNALPALSPVVYEVARRERIPIIQYLHNYRLSCANGFFLNHGKACQRCAQGGFGPAWRTGCWRNSRLASGWMGLILQNMRRQDVFQTVRRWVVPSEAVFAVESVSACKVFKALTCAVLKTPIWSLPMLTSCEPCIATNWEVVRASN